MMENITVKPPEAIREEFLKDLKEKLKGFDHEVVIENGVAMVLAWCGIHQVKSGGAETIVENLLAVAREQGVDESDVFIGGETNVATRMRIAVPGLKIFGFFLLHDDGQVVKKKMNWIERYSKDGSIMSLSNGISHSTRTPENFLKDHAQMITYGKQEMDGESEVRLGSGLVGDTFRIELRKKQ